MKSPDQVHNAQQHIRRTLDQSSCNESRNGPLPGSRPRDSGEPSISYTSLRGLIREGKVYHLLGPPNGLQIEAIESFHPDWDRGVIFVYRPDPPITSPTVFPRGLNPARNYRSDSKRAPTRLRETGPR